MSLLEPKAAEVMANGAKIVQYNWPVNQVQGLLLPVGNCLASLLSRRNLSNMKGASKLCIKMIE